MLFSSPNEMQKCPYIRNECCTNAHHKDALDLINRQKAEIERLKSLERNVYETVEKLKNKIESEARKEFAERLKVKKATFYCKCGLSIDTTELINDDIDNLVKEMEEKSYVF